MSAPIALGGLLARTSDRGPEGMEGVAALAPVLGARLGIEPTWLGDLGEPYDGRWDEDLRDGAGALEMAGAFVAEALAAGSRPVLLSGDCSICLSTLAEVALAAPDVRIVWLDAHGDCNTPATTPSGFLGGMCLGAACGLWTADGFPAHVDPEQVLLGGVRDLDPEEAHLVQEHGFSSCALDEVPDAVAGERVFVHLDLDVCDPSEVPARWPAPGGATLDELEAVLEELAGRAEVLGVEVTCKPGEQLTDEIADLVAGLVA